MSKLTTAKMLMLATTLAAVCGIDESVEKDAINGYLWMKKNKKKLQGIYLHFILDTHNTEISFDEFTIGLYLIIKERKDFEKAGLTDPNIDYTPDGEAIEAEASDVPDLPDMDNVCGIVAISIGTKKKKKGKKAKKADTTEAPAETAAPATETEQEKKD